ncbi:MAG: hypothetical protein P4M08_02860 [Oligoflexia bacterium]|nr:hypothetical protein [Oligoflexia bacterium]
MESQLRFVSFKSHLVKAYCIVLVLFLLPLARAEQGSSADQEAVSPDTRPRAHLNRQAEEQTEQPSDVKTKLIPLPIYATLPNEGSTYGFMPVFLKVRSSNERTEGIYAPSISYNETIGATGTARFFLYPTDHQTLDIVASLSSKVNRGGYVLWQNIPRGSNVWTDEAIYRISRNVFFRYFGIGPDTPSSAESSYTRVFSHGQWRRGYNVTDDFNIGALVNVGRDVVQNIGVPNLPLAPEVFPYAPGMAGSTTVEEAVSFRYDSRVNHDYSLVGFYSEFQVGGVQGIADSPSYLKMQFDTRVLMQETDWMNAGFRALWRYVNSPNVPFYEQSSLGGALVMRGFTEDRFIDQGAWTAEFEERIRVFQTHIYGVTTDWRIDPFIAVGQVYGQDASIASHPQVTGGLGFRAWVRPNVLGRVDVATAGPGQGLETYVELGYPF